MRFILAHFHIKNFEIYEKFPPYCTSLLHKIAVYIYTKFSRYFRLTIPRGFGISHRFFGKKSPMFENRANLLPIDSLRNRFRTKFAFFFLY